MKGLLLSALLLAGCGGRVQSGAVDARPGPFDTAGHEDTGVTTATPPPPADATIEPPVDVMPIDVAPESDALSPTTACAVEGATHPGDLVSFGFSRDPGDCMGSGKCIIVLLLDGCVLQAGHAAESPKPTFPLGDKDCAALRGFIASEKYTAGIPIGRTTCADAISLPGQEMIEVVLSTGRVGQKVPSACEHEPFVKEHACLRSIAERYSPGLWR